MRHIRETTAWLRTLSLHFGVVISEVIKRLNTKRRLLYLKIQSVPRCKHFSSRL